MQNIQYFVANYVDDFMGIETPERVWQAYNTLENLLRDLGIIEAPDKAVPPSVIVEFLGVLFNFLEMTISVTPDRIRELSRELKNWTLHKTYTRRQLETLLGKLQFVSNCVRPGRVMVLRLRERLPLSVADRNLVTQEMLKDIRWWEVFLPVYKGTSIMWMEQINEADALIATDACMTGLGAVGCKQYFSVEVQQEWLTQGYTIAHLEMMAVLVALRVWKKQLHGCRFVINCDNQNVVNAIVNGFTRDMKMAVLLREFAFTCATGEFEVVPRYIRSQDNRLPDLLSRRYLHQKFQNKFEQLKPENYEEIVIHEQFLQLNNNW